MASALHISNANLSFNDTDSENQSDIESHDIDDSNATENLLSFDQSEEEEDLNTEDLTEESSSVAESYDLENSGLSLLESKSILKELSVFISGTLSKSHMRSLLNDFVESECFLIDGDSLFITCFKNMTLEVGQTLHFFYVVEQFLHDFIQKDAKFEIVFFKDVENLYFDVPELLVLRTTLIQHLKCNTDITVHSEFSNCLTQEWELFLTDFYPHFLVVSDKGITSHQTDFLNIFILQALQRKINIVLPFGMESDVLRIYGFYASSNYSHKVYFEEHKEQLQQALFKYIIEYFKNPQKIESYMYDHLEFDSEDIQKEIHEALSLLQNMWPEGADVRSIVCSIACAVTLKLHKRMLHDASDSENLNTDPEIHKTQDLEKVPTLSEAADLCRMHCLSVIFLQQLSLFQRAKSRIITCHWNRSLSPFLKMLKHCAFFILKQIKKSNRWNINFAGLPDLTDDILWKNIAYYYEIEHERGLNLELGDTLMHEYEKLWNIVLTLSQDGDFGGHMPIRTTARPFLIENNKSSGGSNEVIHKLGLIPLKSELVEDFAGDILSELPFLSSEDPAIQSFSTREFDEIRHWHSSRPLSDDFESTNHFQDNSKDTKRRLEAQELCNFYNTFGKNLKENSESVQSKTNEKKSIEENQKRQLSQTEKTDKEIWKNLSRHIEKEIEKNPNVGIKQLEDFLKTCSDKSVKFVAEMLGLDACFKFWMEYCSKPGAESKDLSIVINIMKRIHIIHEKYLDQLQNTHRQKIAKYLKYIGFDNLAHSLCPQISGTEQDISKYSIHMGAARFQLTHMGLYLSREERMDPDPRVQHFIPDTWQRELLDAVDNNESAVIVAPTSSGKTFASYYCMEKILREDNEGVVVYVSPTKALVNQVVGTVCSSFTKALPEGRVVYGVFTRDYRHDVLNCQILVTVPQCLEILLLAPHNQKWTKRIRYVIFDEVHCLGGEIGAEVWEHLLVMIRCPFLALSATISNPEHLTEWLALTKRYWQHIEFTMENSGSSQNSLKDSKKQGKRIEKSSFRVRLVWHKERYSDLEKYVCSLTDNDFVIEYYHPCAALTANHIKKYGIPLDLEFSPRESIMLYDAMAHVWPECPRIQKFEPEEFSFFKNKLVITRADAKKYEKELKKEIIQRIELEQSKVSQVLNFLKPQTFDSPESEYQIMFPYFVEKLNTMNKLPAIFFAFNINRVEISASEVHLNLLKKHTTQNDPNSETSSENVSKKILKGRSHKSTRSQRSRAEINAEIKLLENTLQMHTEEYTYADHTIVDNETLNKILYRLETTRQGYKLRGLLKRGIGFHHGSMEYKERQVVETLFRLRHVQVVTATSSLALGINMPCKSVIFTEDSVYLDALNFRQMSGRAGRRGEDLTGNVFFYGVPLPKIERLLKSNMPKLKGQFPLKLSLVLRLMLLVAKAEDTEDAKAKALSVLQHSLISFKQPKIICMIKYYFIYSLQLLITEGYLNQECIPIGYSGLVSHLHYHEPANFVFVSLLRKGLFHKLCTPERRKGCKTFSEDVMQALVVVLAHLFGRKYFPLSVNECKKKTPDSLVILDDLPEDFAAVIEDYNNRIKNNFVSFLLTISKLADMRKECQLPLSEIDFSGKECEDSKLVSHLMPGTESRTAISPFACLSNITDQDLYDIHVIRDAMLRTINVNISNAPFFHLEKCDKTGRKFPLKAYVLNFYVKESLSALTTDNWLNIGDAFNLIRDFTLVLQSIRFALCELCDDEDDNVVLAFKQLSEAFKEKLWRREY
ncbi:probable ATP-dependent RNA helicase DDX60 [Sorex fumeus]|uniref:probable ATP-dependent RNA helicase DDX60 n=1 Tax=Sorex fumeus TaxID=62283 RepID=UPI0024ADE8BA|nr:probable ATP-dependent RNA helicase DDX60 [Sorex fumeus]